MSDRCPRLVESYRQYFLKNLQPNNFLKILQSYNTRDTLKLARDIAANGKTIYGSNRTLRMACLNMVGEFSPHVDLTVDFNGRLDPEKCTWMNHKPGTRQEREQTVRVYRIQGEERYGEVGWVLWGHLLEKASGGMLGGFSSPCRPTSGPISSLYSQHHVRPSPLPHRHEDLHRGTRDLNILQYRQ